jgi:hypothetical protein
MTIQWLGSVSERGTLGQPACAPDQEGFWDVATQSIVCRPVATAGGISLRQCALNEIATARGCAPRVCPSGTVRGRDGTCVTPQGDCLNPQQVVAAQACFYFDAQGNYVGPAELVQGIDTAAFGRYCLQLYSAGYFDKPLCDPSGTAPAPPTDCLTPEQRGVVKYCRDKGWTGDNRLANNICWTLLKAPDVLAAWEATRDCEPSAPATEPPADIPPGEAALPTAAAEKKSSAVPLLVGAAVVGALAYFFLA